MKSKPNTNKTIQPPVGFNTPTGADEEDNDEGFSLGYSSTDKNFSKPQLAMMSLGDCIKKRSVEMRKGYSQIKYDNHGQKILEYVPDTRKVFKSSVHALRALLAPEVEEDEDYQAAEEKILEEIDNLKIKFGYRPYKSKDVQINDFGATEKQYFVDTDAEYSIPEPGSSVYLIDETKHLKLVPGGWDLQSNEFIDCIVECYDDILCELSKLISRTGGFKRKPRAG